MSERLSLPVLPLREVVLFPGVTAPIGAGRPGTLRAIEAALASPEKLIFAVSQRQNLEQVNPEVLYTIGTVARIGQMQRGLAGMQLLIHGERRGIAMHYGEKDGYLQAIVRDAEEMARSTPRIPRSWRSTVRPGDARPNWARSRGCRKKWSTRSSRVSMNRAGSPT